MQRREGPNEARVQVSGQTALRVGLCTSCSATFQQLFSFRTTFLLSEQFLQFSSNPEISKQPLVLKLTFLKHFTMFQQTIYEFPEKKEPDSPPWGRSWAQDACSRAARSAGFKRKLKMADEACLRCMKKVIQQFLLVHTRIFTRLILILTGAHDYEIMGF